MTRSPTTEEILQAALETGLVTRLSKQFGNRYWIEATEFDSEAIEFYLMAYHRGVQAGIAREHAMNELAKENHKLFGNEY